MEDPVVRKIKKEFDKKGNPAKIPLMSGKQFFEARSKEDGIYVDNLKNQPFLPWKVFSEAVNYLQENGGQAKKGSTTNSRLGDPNLDLNTVEGYIASKVYGCKEGDIVFKRITPVASILAWAEICENTRGQICLIFENSESKSGNTQKEVSLEPNINEKHDYSSTDSLYLALENKDMELKNLKIKLLENAEEIKRLEESNKQLVSELEENKQLLSEKEEKIREFTTAIWEKDYRMQLFEENFAKNLAEIIKLESRLIEKEESISVKDRDLKTLAEEVITKSAEMKRIEEVLAGKEKRFGNAEARFVKNEEKVKKLEKQLSDYVGEERLAAQLREKEELIKQLKGTLASKEEEFSKVNEENRKYRKQQKYASDGLKQIEEQKASKKWWKRI
jgi:hypothetical protein